MFLFASAAPATPVVPSITITNVDESCRLSLLNAWLNQNENDSADKAFIEMFPSTDTEPPSVPPRQQVSRGDNEDDADLLAAMARVQETPLYRAILEDCKFFLGDFHEAAETTCLLERNLYDNPYTRFWDVGPINLDGGLLLAADLLRSSMFENNNAASPLVSCAESCYVRYSESEEDCQEDEQQQPLLFGNNLADLTMLWFGWPNEEDNDLTVLFRNYNQQRTLCDLRWLETDAAYQRLRLCAAESHVGRATIEARSESRDSNTMSPWTAQGLQRASATARAFQVQARHQADCLAARVQQNVCFVDTWNWENIDGGGLGIENVGLGDDFGKDGYDDSGGTNAAVALSNVIAAAAAAALLFLLP